MRKSINYILCLSLLLYLSQNLISQSTDDELDQVELMKQWIGTWKCEIANDNIIIWDLKPFGKGYELYYKNIANGKTIYEIKDLWAFDSKSDKWICFSLEGSGIYKMYYGKFISSNKFNWDRYDIANPEKTLGIWGFTFYPQSERRKFDFIDPNSPTVLTFYRVDVEINTNHQ